MTEKYAYCSTVPRNLAMIVDKVRVSCGARASLSKNRQELSVLNQYYHAPSSLDAKILQFLENTFKSLLP